MNNYAHCIDRIKEYAKNQGITMKHLCDQLGRQRSFLANVRNGSDNLKDDQLEIIAGILRTTPAYLKGETDDPAPPESDWMEKIKKDPVKAELMAKLSELDVDTLLKVEQIVDMIKQERT